MPARLKTTAVVLGPALASLACARVGRFVISPRERRDATSRLKGCPK